MKLFKIAIPFWQHWLQVYAQHPELDTQAWVEQQATVSANWFGFPHVWKYALESLGYEVIEILANVDVIQKRWAAENGVDYREAFWSQDIAKAQILKEKPDILFVADLFWFSSDWVKEVRQQCPSVKLVLGWYGAPIQNENILKNCDLVLSCIPELVEKCQAQNLRSHHLNHSFDPRLLDHLNQQSEPVIDLSFVGNIRRNLRFDSGREAILEALVLKADIEIFSGAANSQENLPDLLKLLAKISLFNLSKNLKKAAISPSLLDKIPILGKASSLKYCPVRAVNPKLMPYLKQPVYGIDMFQTLRNSKITLNKHIDASPRSASNMRMFEATGVGTCLITDYKDNIRTLFEPDYELITYKSAEECSEKVTWLLAHPKEREAIAKAGQSRTLKNHTIDQRAHQLDEILRQALMTCVS
jgi:spore maturation protein CgeB